MTLLVLTNTKDETANYLCQKLQDNATRFHRLDTDTCIARLTTSYTNSHPQLRWATTTLVPTDIQHVWLRRPRPITIPPLSDPASDAHIANEWSEALEGFLAHIPAGQWMNHPLQNVRASHKLDQLTQATAIGLCTPDTLLTQSPNELADFAAKHHGRIIVKPLASGIIERTGSATTQIYTNRVEAHDHQYSELLGRCPTFFQEEIIKTIDIRIIAIDDILVATALRPAPHLENHPDIRRENMTGVTYKPIRIPAEIEEKIRRLLTSYRLRFAAIDFGVTPEGDWVFFEINPNGQWAWLDLVGATQLWVHFARAFRCAS